MRVPIADFRDDIAGYLQEVLSSTPSYIGDTVIVRAGRQSADEIHPMLPNSWHDEDSKKVTTLTIPASGVGEPGVSTGLTAGTKALPSDCLEVGSFDLNEVNQRAFIVYDGADFAARKARMGPSPVSGLFEMVFHQQGKSLRYWYKPSATKSVEMTYIPRCPDPSAVGNVMLIAERAKPLIVAHAAATLKLKDLRAEDYKVLWELFVSKWSMAVVAQYTKILNDPFVRRGAPIIPVGGGQGQQ